MLRYNCLCLCCGYNCLCLCCGYNCLCLCCGYNCLCLCCGYLNESIGAVTSFESFYSLRRDRCLLFFQLKCIICRTAYFDENINTLKKSPRMKTLRVYPGRYFPMEHAGKKGRKNTVKDEVVIFLPAQAKLTLGSCRFLLFFYFFSSPPFTPPPPAPPPFPPAAPLLHSPVLLITNKCIGACERHTFLSLAQVSK